MEEWGGRMKQNKYWLGLGILGLLAAVCFGLYWQSQGLLAELNQANQALAAANEQLTAETSSAAKEIQELKSRVVEYDQIIRTMPNLDPTKAAAWQAQGMILDPQKIAADLAAHPELIPFPGVLGGTMGFYDPGQIYVLTNQWVVAGFEDGHVGGYIFLKYEQKAGKIIWKVLDAYLW